MSRSPEQIQREIELSRSELAVTLDQLADRVSPKRLAGEAKDSAVSFFQTPPGYAVLGTVALLIVLKVVRRVRAS